MLNLPAEVTVFLAQFAPLFTPSVWYHAQVLVVGAILTPGNRTVAAILSVMGLRHSRHFQNYHRVLNRDRWSSRVISKKLLQVLLDVFVPQGPIVLADLAQGRLREKRSQLEQALVGILRPHHRFLLTELLGRSITSTTLSHA